MAVDPKGELGGRRLGEFIVRERIGEGGFGAVYRAEQPLLGRAAVIKVLHRRLQSSKAVVQRFMREARLASQLDHPYAAHIYAFGLEPDGLLWIAMEMVHGTGLDVMLRDGPIPLEQLASLVDRLAEVVRAAHDRGIVHRDIKPSNVMVMSRVGRLLPKLLDFGIAKALVGQPMTGESIDPLDETALPAADNDAADDDLDDTVDTGAAAELDDEAVTGADDDTVAASDSSGSSGSAAASPRDAELTAAGAMMGSPPYMAPEQWVDAKAADARTDQYALAVLTYEALVGKRPFRARRMPDLMLAHASEPVPPVPDELPAELNAVFARALAKSPEDRYPTTLEFAAAFRDAAGLSGALEPLPKLDERVKAAVLADAPQPLAECVAALDAARNAHQARHALRQVARTAVRWVTLLALAAHSQTGAGHPENVARMLRELRRRSLNDDEWASLARGLLRSFAASPELHPIPELVALFFPDRGATTAKPFAALLAIESEVGAGSSRDQVIAELERAVPEVTRLLQSLSFLADLSLVVRRDGHAERWSGVRRPQRPIVSTTRALTEGEPVVLDADGNPILRLAPLVQTASPTPGARPEMFLFEGHGRHGARMIAPPFGFERSDDAVWAWFGEQLIADTGVTPTTPSGERPPYRGLAAFGADDADDFFGRERAVESLVNRLRVEPLIAVVGPSGAGKSSLVAAGVVPSLPVTWKAITVRPGNAPLAALAGRLSRERPEAGDLAERMPADPRALGRELRAIAGDGVAVLVIDQLEELFTVCHDVDQREQLVASLCEAARTAEEPVRVIVTLRDDFLIRAGEIPQLRERLSRGVEILGTPDPVDLRRILIEPLARCGYELEDEALGDQMVEEVSGRPGALALLSFTAAKLWDHRDRHFKRLTRKAYEAIGGIGGALAAHAESTLEAMSPDNQRLVREAFRHLVTAEGTRAIVTHRELSELLGDGGEVVIEKLVEARLLTVSEAAGGEDRVEVVHEALLAEWPRLVAWRAEDAAGAQLRDQLRAAARQWDERDRPRGLLWRDDALTEYQLWRARHPGNLTRVEQAFADASAADARRGRRLKRGAAIALVAILAATSAVLFLANRRVELERARADEERTRAIDNAAVARERLRDRLLDEGRRNVIDGRPALGLVYLAEARRMDASGLGLELLMARAARSVEAQRVTLRGHRGQLQLARFGRSDDRVLTAGEDGTAVLWASGAKLATMRCGRGVVWDARFDPGAGRIAIACLSREETWGEARVFDAAGREIATLPHPESATAVGFWRDRLVTTSLDGGIRIWDLATPGAPIAVLREPGDIRWLAIAGDRAYTGSLDTRARIWNLERRRLLHTLEGHSESLSGVAVSPDGSRVATASEDRTARLWDASRGVEIAVLRGHTDGLEGLAFSPDGTRLATASRDRSAKLWSVPDGVLTASFEGHEGSVLDVGFDAAGQRVVTAGADGQARIWDVETGALLSLFDAHGAAVKTAEFSEDGGWVLTASLDGTAKMWVARTTEIVATLAGHRDRVRRIAVSADGARLVSGGFDGTAMLWDVDARQRVAAIDMGAPRTRAVAFSADGRLAAAGGGAGVIVVDARGGRRLGTLGGLDDPLVWLAFTPDATAVVAAAGDRIQWWDWPSGHPGPTQRCRDGSIQQAALSPDGALVAAACDQTLVLWERTGALRAALEGHEKPIRNLAFGPGGQIATAGSDRRIGLFSADPPAHVGWLDGHEGAVFDVDFDSRGERLVSASEDGTARLWRIRDRSVIATLEGHSDMVYSVRFDPADELVLTSSKDRTARLWDAREHRLLAIFSGHQSSVLDARFVPGRQLIATASWDHTLKLFSIARSRVPETLLGCLPVRLQKGELVPTDRTTLITCETTSAAGNTKVAAPTDP